MTIPPPPPPPPEEPSVKVEVKAEDEPTTETATATATPVAIPIPTPTPTSNVNVNVDEAVLAKVGKAASLLETNRCLESEHEAALHFASTLLSHPHGLPHDGSSHANSNTSGKGSGPENAQLQQQQQQQQQQPSIAIAGGRVPLGVKDAWLALVQNSNAHDYDLDIPSNHNPGGDIVMGGADHDGGSNNHNGDGSLYEYPLPRGQLAKATKITALSTSLQRTATIAQQLKSNQINDATFLTEALKAIAEHTTSTEGDGNSTSTTTPQWFMDLFDTKVREIREYHAKHPTVPNGMDATNTIISPNNNDYSPMQQMSAMNEGGGDPRGMIMNQIILNNNHPSGKKRKMGNPMADGYDLHSIIHQPLSRIKTGQTFSMEEVMGKYLDLQSIHQSILSSSQLNVMFGSVNVTTDANGTVNANGGATSTNNARADNAMEVDGDSHNNNTNSNSNSNGYNHITYPDFLSLIAQGLFSKIPESYKLKQRKHYLRFLHQLEVYLVSFLQRVSPLLHVQSIVLDVANHDFDTLWSIHGGIPGSWELKPAEKKWIVKNANVNKNVTTGGEQGQAQEQQQQQQQQGINLKKYGTVQDLMDQVSADDLKVELARLGMKCGGTPADRAKRLWHARDTPLDQLPPKLFAKKKKNGVGGNGKKGKNNSKGGAEEGANTSSVSTLRSSSTSSDVVLGSNQRRVDIARLEAIVSALLNQVRPTLDATARRAERRLTQTSNEKEREMEEELTGAYEDSKDGGEGQDGERNGGGGDDSDSDDDEDAPIYNPKGVPLDWDGKPIPYWLYKLHGLNHFYQCEICGNVSYRGRHNFEKHFAEVKHSYGMKCLGIPNTKHFHGVTKIQDAQNLWKKLQLNVNKDIFDASKEEEYEDSHGNVLSRATYEDLARQGLL